MSTSHTYETLTDALQAWEEDTGAQFQAQLDTIIGLGEVKLLRDLEIELFNAKYPATVTSGNQSVARRTEFISIRTVSIVTAAGKYKALEPATNEFLDEYWKDSTALGEPEYYTELDEASIRVVPTPDQAYSGFMRGIVRPTQLSDETQTTWLSEKCGDLLFWACLIASEIYIKEDLVSDAGRIAGLKQVYADSLNTARIELRMQVNADYSPVTPTPDA